MLKKTKSGFSIVEVMIALVIFSTTILGLYRLLIKIKSVEDASHHQLQVYQFAMQIINNIAANSAESMLYIENGYNDHQSLSYTTAASRAENDLIIWKSYIKHNFHGTIRAIVCADSKDAAPHIPTPGNPNCNGSLSSHLIAVKVLWQNNNESPSINHYLILDAA